MLREGLGAVGLDRVAAEVEVRERGEAEEERGEEEGAAVACKRQCESIPEN